MRQLILATLLSAIAALPVYAGEREDLETLRNTTVNLLKLLVREGVLTQDKADTLIKEAERKSTPDSPAAATENKPVVRVPYVPEVVRQEIRDQLKQEVLAQAKAERWGDAGALPEWIGNIKWEGDLRLRYQKDIYQPSNFDLTTFQALTLNTGVDNTQFDRTRFLLRARPGMSIKVSDSVTAGIRLATGNNNSPVSTNQTLGSGFNKNAIWLDRAFVRFHPYDWFEFSAGRMPNPWFSTDLVWNENLNFEGFAASIKPRFSETLRGFVTAGAFPLQNSTPSPFSSPKNKWLYGAQVGADWEITENARGKLGLALYDYRNYEGLPNNPPFTTTFDASAPPSKQKGNTLFDITNPVVAPAGGDIIALLAKFRPLNLTGSLDLANWSPVHLTFTGDVVKNIGYSQSEILARTGINWKPRTFGYNARVALGYLRIERRHDWQAFVGYRYLQRDAVVDAFTDSDFHLGGTDAKGFMVGGAYGIDRNTWLSLRWLSANQIDGPPLAIDVLQFDLNLRF
jgi:hypothetical protein